MAGEKGERAKLYADTLLTAAGCSLVEGDATMFHLAPQPGQKNN